MNRDDLKLYTPLGIVENTEGMGGTKVYLKDGKYWANVGTEDSPRMVEAYNKGTGDAPIYGITKPTDQANINTSLLTPNKIESPISPELNKRYKSLSGLTKANVSSSDIPDYPGAAKVGTENISDSKIDDTLKVNKNKDGSPSNGSVAKILEFGKTYRLPKELVDLYVQMSAGKKGNNKVKSPRSTNALLNTLGIAMAGGTEELLNQMDKSQSASEGRNTFMNRMLPAYEKATGKKFTGYTEEESKALQNEYNSDKTTPERKAEILALAKSNVGTGNLSGTGITPEDQGRLDLETASLDNQTKMLKQSIINKLAMWKGYGKKVFNDQQDKLTADQLMLDAQRLEKMGGGSDLLKMITDSYNAASAKK
ncbi:MAG: hypothetical protein ACYDEI_00125 [Erysipelotrichaceae bacterium]